MKGASITVMEGCDALIWLFEQTSRWPLEKSSPIAMQSDFVLIIAPCYRHIVHLELSRKPQFRPQLDTRTRFEFSSSFSKLDSTRSDFMYHRVEVIFKLQFNNCQYRFRHGEPSHRISKADSARWNSRWLNRSAGRQLGQTRGLLFVKLV